MRPAAGQRGFILAETLLGLGLSGVVLSLAVGAMFQAWTLERTQRHDVVATGQLRQAAWWLANDTLRVQRTDLSEGAGPVSGVSLSWTDARGVGHAASYGLEGTHLVRTFDGLPITVAREVVSTAFSRSSSTIFVTLVVKGTPGETKSLTLRTYLRAAGGP